MRRLGRLLLFGSFVFLWLGPTTAEALRRYMSQVPNGPRYGCVLCHTNTVTVAFNLFGDDVRAHFAQGLPDWSVIGTLDSDGDGQTNGEELGDPCGTWRLGEPAGRYTELSLPGDATSLSGTPSEPSCEGTKPDSGAVPDPQDKTEESDSGGCRCLRPSSALSLRDPTFLALCLLCSGWILRARRVSSSSPPPSSGHWSHATPAAGTESSER